jgi:hypothetical protein
VWYLSVTAKSGLGSCAFTVSKNVFCCVGLTVLMEENARPRRPSLSTS